MGITDMKILHSAEILVYNTENISKISVITY